MTTGASGEDFVSKSTGSSITSSQYIFSVFCLGKGKTNTDTEIHGTDNREHFFLPPTCFIIWFLRLHRLLVPMLLLLHLHLVAAVAAVVAAELLFRSRALHPRRRQRCWLLLLRHRQRPDLRREAERQIMIMFSFLSVLHGWETMLSLGYK